MVKMKATRDFNGSGVVGSRDQGEQFSAPADIADELENLGVAERVESGKKKD
jgi:hypothetical protein